MSNILGTVNSDYLIGTDSSDEINGLAGADLMAGGYGEDTYYVDNVGDIVQDGVWQASPNSTALEFQSELDDGAVDTIVSSVNYTLSEGIENLTLTKTAINGTGNALDNIIKGNDSNNVLDGAAGEDSLYGGAGNDTLNGGTDKANDILDGGVGADTMTGGAGDDMYYVDNAGDKVIEISSGGNDTVLSTIDYTLADNVEKLILVEDAVATKATGNAMVNTLVGNTAANILDGGKGADVMIGGAGNDTYYVDSTSDTVKEYRAEGTDNVISSVSYSLSSNIENLTLSGTGSINGTGNALDNIITGNDLKNTLIGGAGRDQLFGGGGNDILNGGIGLDLMNGGEGSDTYFVDSHGDTVVDSGTGAKDIDIVNASVSYSMVNGIEKLLLDEDAGSIDGTGNALNNTITGNDFDNVLDGGKGNDTLQGNDGDDVLLGGSGTNTLDGGLGDDTYIISSSTDTIKDAGGFDVVQTYVDFQLAEGIEEAHLSGEAKSLIANKSDNILYGNESDNTIAGGAGKDYINTGAGNDTLDGGTGIDELNGGSGNDTYYVDNSKDKVVEYSANGVDQVISTTNYTLANNVENLTLATGSKALLGIGNDLNNIITGNAMNNTLLGGAGNDTLYGGNGDDKLTGGTGADIMDGGQGADTYYVDATTDTVIESSTDTDIDTVISSVAYSLKSGVENLTLTGTATSGAGNELANVLIGNDAANTLEGGAGNDTLDGGKGVDKLFGGTGADTYYVNDANDVISETGTDIDTVYSTASSYDISGLVENLNLAGTANINGYGNALANIINGNSGNNIMDGGEGNDRLNGGAGNDQLYGCVGTDTVSGGAGADVFGFENINDFGGIGSSRDVITDFKTTEGDKISLAGIDANLKTSGDQAFSFVSEFTTSHDNYQVMFSNGVLQINTDDDTTAEYEIALTGVTTLAATDLIL